MKKWMIFMYLFIFLIVTMIFLSNCKSHNSFYEIPSQAIPKNISLNQDGITRLCIDQQYMVTWDRMDSNAVEYYEFYLNGGNPNLDGKKIRSNQTAVDVPVSTTVNFQHPGFYNWLIRAGNDFQYSSQAIQGVICVPPDYTLTSKPDCAGNIILSFTLPNDVIKLEAYEKICLEEISVSFDDEGNTDNPINPEYEINFDKFIKSNDVPNTYTTTISFDELQSSQCIEGKANSLFHHTLKDGSNCGVDVDGNMTDIFSEGDFADVRLLPPISLSPPDLSQIQTDLLPTFSWDINSSCKIPDNIVYQIQISTDKYGTMLYDDTTTTKSYIPLNALPNSCLWWGAISVMGFYTFYRIVYTR